MSPSCWCINVIEVEFLRPNSLDYLFPIQLVHPQAILHGHEVSSNGVFQLICCHPGWESKLHLVGNAILVLQHNEFVVPTKHPTDGLGDLIPARRLKSGQLGTPDNMRSTPSGPFTVLLIELRMCGEGVRQVVELSWPYLPAFMVWR
eukprot:6487420-Amphidinium_carterae.1